MQMTLEQRMAQLEARCAMLEGRVVQLEARNMTYGPLPAIPPTNPWPNFPDPRWVPPFTITCKMADGTTKDIKLDGPIVAQAQS